MCLESSSYKYTTIFFILKIKIKLLFCYLNQLYISKNGNYYTTIYLQGLIFYTTTISNFNTLYDRVPNNRSSGRPARTFGCRFSLSLYFWASVWMPSATLSIGRSLSIERCTLFPGFYCELHGFCLSAFWQQFHKLEGHSPHRAEDCLLCGQLVIEGELAMTA